MPARTSSSYPARDNIVEFPPATHPRRLRDPSQAPTRSAAEVARFPPKVTVLPAARPAPLPPSSEALSSREPVAYCFAGGACVAHATLGSPAKLSRHNRQRIGGERYCYGCHAKIADERTRTLATRRRPEASAATYHKRPGTRTDGSREAQGQTASGTGAAGRIPSAQIAPAEGAP